MKIIINATNVQIGLAFYPLNSLYFKSDGTNISIYENGMPNPIISAPYDVFMDTNNSTFASADVVMTLLKTSFATTGFAAGEAHLGEVGGNTTKPSTTPVVSTSQYTSGDNVGGIVTIENAVRVSGGSEVLMSVDIWDKDNQKAAFTIDYFSASPSGTYTDNLAQVMAGDHANWLGSVIVNATDYVTQGAIARASIKPVSLPIIAAAGQVRIYYVISTTSTPTYTSTSALVIKHGFLRD